LKAQMAEYIHFFDPVESQNLLGSALGDNGRLTRPIAGLLYQHLIPTTLSQAQLCLAYLNDNFAEPNKLVVATNALLESLLFEPETASTFEEALKNVAFLLGFRGQRPEDEFGRGPDVLWEVGAQQYLVIECKNGATNEESITKTYANQLNGSMIWFQGEYDQTCVPVPIMVHPSTLFEFASSPHPDTRIITKVKLGELKDAVRSFVQAISQSAKRDATSIGHLLTHLQLSRQLFLSKFTVGFQKKK
jgi:hypothetical protein